MNRELFEMALLLLLPSVGASYLASVLCRLAHSLHYRARWWIGLASTVIAMIFVGSLVFIGSRLQPGQEPMGMVFVLFISCVPGGALAAIPAHIVVWLYGRKYGKRSLAA